MNPDNIRFQENFEFFLKDQLKVPAYIYETVPFMVFTRMDHKTLGYHNPSHVLRMFDFAKDHKIELSDTEQLAIWFHDVVYIPLAEYRINELRSLWFMQSMLEGIVDQEILENAGQIILDTADHLKDDFSSSFKRRSNFPPEMSNKVLDLDLAHFSYSRDKYNNSSKDLENEFIMAGTTKEKFDIGRKSFLQKLLSKKTIYRTDFFLDNFEDKARENIRLDIESLS